MSVGIDWLLPLALTILAPMTGLGLVLAAAPGAAILRYTHRNRWWGRKEVPR